MDKKGKSMEQTMREEIMEETGFDVPLDRLEFVKTLRGGFGLMANRFHTFYCEVTDRDQTGPGGGLVEAGEFIELAAIPSTQIVQFIDDDSKTKPTGLLYLLMWWLTFHADNSIE